MKRTLFYNSVVFRLAAPVLFGVLAYLLVLMFFDSVGMLAENFFSREVLFVIGLTYLFFEANRLVIVAFNKVIHTEKNFRVRMISQFIAGALISVAIISSILYYYFIHVEGFSTINTELITFNSIFVLISMFYHLYFFSLVFLSRKNEHLIQKQRSKKQELELEMETFRNRVNPDFLFESLEIIIAEFHKNKKQADELVSKLALVYRYSLDNSQKELVTIQEEVNILKLIISIFEAKYTGMIVPEISVDGKIDSYVIPGVLHVIFERAILQNIITSSLPFKFVISVEDEFISVSYSSNPKISKRETESDPLDQIKKAYAFYTDKKIEKVETNGEIQIRIPILSIEEE